MQFTFWGVRGSFPAPGAETIQYGGNTPCLEVEAEGTHLIVDAGTGIYALGKHLSGGAIRHHHIIFSHVHWDHIQGLPFFHPLQDPDAQITIYAPPRPLLILQELFTHGFRQIYLPVPPSRLRARIDFQPFHMGERWKMGDLEIDTVRLNHPNFCVGFRFRSGSHSVVFYSDTAPFDDILFGYEYHPRPPRLGEKPDIYELSRLSEMRQAVIRQSSGADILIHDAHFTPEEYPRFSHFGHSTPVHALDLAQDAGVKKLLLFHHAPGRTDAQVAEMEAIYRPIAAERGIILTAAREGERISF